MKIDVLHWMLKPFTLDKNYIGERVVSHTETGKGEGKRGKVVVEERKRKKKPPKFLLTLLNGELTVT